MEEDDRVFVEDQDQGKRGVDDTLRRLEAGRQYGYTGPLADIVGAAHRLRNVPADHDLRVLKIHQKQNTSSAAQDEAQTTTASSTRNQIMDDIIHKTILVGDSGVGKTSLLVQFDTGKFNLGAFSATVGIGFTVSLLSL
jgi:hypothetical protein